ncbi:MAG: hypothetical protein ABS76_31680 [Pelagibacterium sp. SCN 64-44]|nr:MAG: hypothetical protein ABS76_31680 [Pelagibacterium sp. SCN 64-44]
MTRPCLALLLHALFALAALYALGPVVARHVEGVGFLVVMLGAQALLFGLPAIVFHIDPLDRPLLFSEKLAWRDWWIFILLAIQPPALALALLMPHTAILTSPAASLAALIGLLHGPLTEIGWRGALLSRFGENSRLGFALSWLLPLLAQGALWPLPGLALPIEPAGLLAGSGLLGLFWTWLAWRSFSVFWTSIAHALSSTILLWLLLSANGIA